MGMKERLIEIRDAIGSNADLARVAGVSRSNVTQWMEGDIKSLKAVSALAIEEETGYSARWIVLGRLPKKVQSVGISETSPIPYGSTDAKIKEPITDEQKLVEIVRIFQETDTKGRDAIWAGAKVALRRAASRPRRKDSSTVNGR